MNSSIVRKSMSWITQHWEMAVTIGGLGITQLASYLKLHWRVNIVEKKTDDQETVIDSHVASPVLHRTPDFEKGQSEIKAEMVRMNGKLDRVLELLPRPR